MKLRVLSPLIKSNISSVVLKMNSTDSAGESCTWRGVSLTEIYGSQSPWGAPEFPLVSPSFNHAVMYHISSQGTQISDQPPKPQIGQDKWDQEHVRLPCSSQSLYPVESNGQKTLKRRWELIQEALQKPIQNSEQLANAILTYNTHFKLIWKFQALHALFNNYLEEEESQYFFNVTLPEIAKLALALPKLIQAPIPLLKQHKNKSISLSQQQIASLLANAFFCTFPRRNSFKKSSEYASYPHINFTMLYECAGTDSILEKLKSLCYYFRRVCTIAPLGVVTFSRRSVPPRSCPSWSSCDVTVANTPLHVNSSGTIEDDGVGLIQVDFANKYLGGGVLGRGCVQEEIRFIICPELMASMLFTEVLRPNEAVLILGCERYSDYTGYGHRFRWSGGHHDATPRDCSGRLRCAVLAIDAMPFNSKQKERSAECLARECDKAWVGMSFHTSPDDLTLQRPGVATGNWGCGAFGGSKPLKCLLQLMAASVAKRPMAYYTFSDVKLRNNFIKMYHLLAKHSVTVGELYNYLVKFSESPVPMSQLYEFLHQCMLDGEKPGGKVEIMDISESSDNHDVTDQPKHPINSNISHTTSIKTSEVKITIIPQDVNDQENSPDMFSQESLTCRTEESKVNEDDSYTKVNKAQNVVTAERAKRTSTLFDEMRKLDEENGMNNIDKHQNNSILCLSKDKTNDETKVISSSEERFDTISVGDETLSAVHLPTDVKKKISKKITDYFKRT